jgi:hypothetical protein
MGFDPWNFSLKVWESIGTPTPQMGAHLGMWGFNPSHFLTLPGAQDATLWLPSWLTPLQALALVASPRLGLRHPTFGFPTFEKDCVVLDPSLPKVPISQSYSLQSSLHISYQFVSPWNQLVVNLHCGFQILDNHQNKSHVSIGRWGHNRISSANIKST